MPEASPEEAAHKQPRDDHTTHWRLLPILLTLANLILFTFNTNKQGLLATTRQHDSISIGLEFKNASHDTYEVVFAEKVSRRADEPPSVSITVGSKQQSPSISKKEEQPQKMKQTRRTKVHLCRNPTRSRHGYRIMRDEFGFDRVNATAGEEWDVVFGGYPNCGSVKRDYQMQTGLNQKLLKQGFDSLKPHQVYFPCMGCTDSYCNKEKLCRLQRSIDPESCYLLPEDRTVLVKKMKESPGETWVLKHDSSTTAVHSGTGVQLINSIDQLPEKKQLEKSSYLVQPFIDSYMGEGDLRRKTEVRYYVAITSITPLRVYYFNDQWMPLSSTLWVDEPRSDLYKKCMQDSHAYKKACKSVAKRRQGEKRVRFSEYQKATGMPKETSDKFHQQATDMMLKIFEASHASMQNNTINRGITSSGASCFSFMRADFGISAEGNAFLYEINELPFGKEPRIAGEVQQNAFRDLFKMIGLDDIPLPASERAAYEARNSGNWTLFPTFASS